MAAPAAGVETVEKPGGFAPNGARARRGAFADMITGGFGARQAPRRVLRKREARRQAGFGEGACDYGLGLASRGIGATGGYGGFVHGARPSRSRYCLGIGIPFSSQSCSA